MEDWDSPRRSKFFLSAALLTAVAGFLMAPETERWQPPALSAGEAATAVPPRMGAAPEETRPAPISGASADGSGARPSAAESAHLRDALNSPSNWASQATRSAAFLGPAGRVPGAFAPAAAPDAAAAARSVSGPAAPSPARQPAARAAAARAYAPAAAPSKSDASRPVGAAYGEESPAPRRTAAERLLAGPEEPSSQATRPASNDAARRARAAAPPAQAATPRQQQQRERQRRAVAPSLERLLGRGALKAPQGVKIPASDPWAAPPPATGPDGAALSARPLGVAAAEAIEPPAPCARRGAHWDRDGAASWWHDGVRRGRLAAGSWAWLERHESRWWIWPQPSRPPMVQHQDHWWTRSSGLWFMLHDGDPWGWQFLREWESLGFVHSSGSRMIYSADGARLGLILPGQGAVLYDAATGAELGRWSESELPRRPIAVSEKLLRSP